MNVLFWLYILNSLFLINHEIDSAYWNEWKLFKLKGGIAGFLVFNLIVIFIALVGIVPVYLKTFAGFVFSIAIALTGIFTFCIHMFFISRGRKEFKTLASLAILVGILVISIIQLTLALLSL